MWLNLLRNARKHDSPITHPALAGAGVEAMSKYNAMQLVSIGLEMVVIYASWSDLKLKPTTWVVMGFLSAWIPLGFGWWLT